MDWTDTWRDAFRLRHPGNALAAATGASTKELMARMGHSSVRAALIYQHASRSRDKQIADAISQNIRAARGMGHAKARPSRWQGDQKERADHTTVV
jgi:hypothetical protein